MRPLLLWAMLGCAACAGLQRGDSSGGISAERLRHAVVAVRVTRRDWNWKNPWKRQDPRTVEFTGIVVAGNRILVPGTQLFAPAFIEVQRLGDPTWHAAKVGLIDYDLPLALLEVEAPEFWEGLDPLPMASTVPTAGEVQIAKWVSGRLELSPATVTKLDSLSFWYGHVHGLALRLAAPSVSISHGEAVIAGGQLAGMVSGGSKEGWFAFGSPFLEAFRAAALRGSYAGFGRLGTFTQDLTNPALREYLGLGKSEGGVRITRLMPHGSAANILRAGDILLQANGHAIDAAGNIQHPQYGLQHWGILVTDGKAAGDSLDFLVLRDGKRQSISVPIKRSSAQDDRIPRTMAGQKPEYLIEGGLVFQHLTGSYLYSFPNWRKTAPSRLVVAHDLDGEQPSAEHPRTVVLTSVLPDPANLGYQELHDLIVDRVNGVSVRNLEDVKAAFAHPGGAFDVVEFLPGQGTRRIVLDVKEVEAASSRVQLD